MALAENRAQEEIALTDDRIENHAFKKKLRKTFYAGVLGFVLNYAGFLGLMDLQSSINVEAGLGATTMLILFVVSILSAMFIAPSVLDLYGVKPALLSSDVAFCIFTIANFYPTWFTMIPVSVICGVTICFTFACMSTMISYVSMEMWKLKGSKGGNHKKMLGGYFGKYYAILSFGRAAGSALSYMVLFGFKKFTMGDDAYAGYALNGTEFFTLSPNVTSASVEEEVSWENCVGNDCQMDYVYNTTTDTLQKFKPDQMSIYILVGIVIALQLLTLLTHIFIMPGIPTKSQQDGEHERPPILAGMKEELVKSFYHWISPQHLLIFPISTYVGFNLTFVVSEFNRAYVSCTIGVESIGLCMMIYGFAGFLMSTVVSRFSKHFGRVQMLLTAVCLDVTNYAVALAWTPKPETIFILYLMAGMFGMTYTLLMNGVANVVAIFFSDRTAIAYSTQMLALNLGAVVGFSWSIPLCVRHKLCILIPYVIAAACCWGIAEIRFKKMNKKLKTVAKG